MSHSLPGPAGDRQVWGCQMGSILSWVIHSGKLAPAHTRILGLGEWMLPGFSLPSVAGSWLTAQGSVCWEELLAWDYVAFLLM